MSSQNFFNSLRTMISYRTVALALGLALTLHTNAQAEECSALPSYKEFKEALTNAQRTDNGGLGFNMWGAMVNRDGVVCAVAFTGAERGDQFPASRVIAAQKANSANAFSLPINAISTANLYAATQPGGTLFGLQESNPINPGVSYKGNPEEYGTSSDALVGKRIGGINVFGGGLPLYTKDGSLVGALGVSGDTSCSDHLIAWKVRHELNLDYVPNGVAGDQERPDTIVFDLGENDKSASGWGHPACGDKVQTLAKELPPVRKKTD